MSTRDAADFLHRAAQFDSKDLRAKIGGLLLLPENASRVARLEFAVHLAASLPPTQTTSTISANDLRQLLNNSIIGHSYMVANEDPVAGMFTEALSFTGGSYVVFPGIVTDAAFITRHLLRALVDPHQAYPDGDFPRHAHDLSLAVLALSNAIAERLGMQRGIAPVERPNDPSIEVPDDPKLSRYAKALTFSLAELDSVLGSACGASALTPLILDTSVIHMSSVTPHDGPLQARPIVRGRDCLIVTAPTLLLPALRHALVCMAAEKGVTEHLTRELAAYAWSTAAFWLNALGYSYAGIRSYSIPSCVSATGLFGFDADKAMYACLVVDDLSNYDQAAVFGAQPDRDTWETVGPHLRETSIAIKTSDSPPSTILCLLLHFGIGRSNAIRGPARNEMIDYELLMMSVSELESVAILHAPDELLFWRFAQDLNDLHKRTHVFSTDLLNLFGFYRSRDYCFYLSDEAVPTALLLGSDWEGDLRREAFNKTDIHAARAPGGNGFVDVALLHARRSIPVYVPVGDIGHRSAVVVECYSIPVWILDGTPEETDRLQNRGVLNLISDSIAFWLWQVSPSFREWFDATLGQEQLLLAIELRAKEPLDPNLSSDADDVSDTSFFVVEPIFEEQCIRCELHP